MPAPKKPPMNESGESSGIALFLVIAAMTMLAVLVTEFTYVAQVNSRLAYDGLDQIRAHYVAKSALKISLLRLKAYKSAKGMMGQGGGAGAAVGAAMGITPGMLDKIWSFPFIYPFPELPGMTMTQKDSLKKFQKESGLPGKFTANIDSESSKYNLNSLLQAYVPAQPTPSPSPSSNSPNPTPTPSPSASAGPDPKAQQESFGQFLSDIMKNRFETDQDFAVEYRDFRIEELVDNIIAWVDRTYQARPTGAAIDYKPKKAPFYSLSELHMIPKMDDKLYDLFSPNLTVLPTSGINVNKVNKVTLMALVTGMTKDEADLFFKFRDATDQDNLFKETENFFKYLQQNVASFHNSSSEINTYKENLKKRGIVFIVEETSFKVTVQAQVGNATRLIEAWVNFEESANPNPGSGGNPQPGTNPTPVPTPTPVTSNTNPLEPKKNSPGLKITYMRML